jgi:hypothetical protein
MVAGWNAVCQADSRFDWLPPVIACQVAQSPHQPSHCRNYREYHGGEEAKPEQFSSG